MSSTTSKTIKLDIFGNSYEVAFPKTGAFIDIQTIKSKLTEDRFESFKMMERDGLLAYMFVETIATFNVMIPALKEDLNVNGLLDLELDKMISLVYVYKDTWSPWYEKWLEILTNPKKKEPEASKENKANAT